MYKEENLLEDSQPSYSNSKMPPLIYSWGRNEDGQLAISNTKSSLPSAARGFKGYAQYIATARTHTAIINSEGQIYLTGSLLFGKIGIPSTVNNFRQFHLHSSMSQHNIIKVACGDYHTLALSDSGVVYSWGGSLWDKTGHKGGGIHKIERLNNKNITDIACGDFHSVALTETGEVYSWGGGGKDKNKGQLGHGNKKDLPHPELIQFFKNKKVKKIACGDYHTMMLTNSEQLYAFGDGNYGQLGIASKQQSPTPKKVTINFSIQLQNYFNSSLNLPTKIQQIALGGKHSLLLTNKGNIYVCGHGAQGQLGLSTTDNKYEPTLVKQLMGKKIVMIAAGANHSLCVTKRHRVYSCGYNAKGQLGIGDEKSSKNWTIVTALQQKPIGWVFAGGDHSWAVVDETKDLNDMEESQEEIQPVEHINSKEITEIPQARIDKEKQNESSSFDNILHLLNSPHKLELILTQVQLSHRFIHFEIKQSHLKSYKKKLDTYIQQIRLHQKQNYKYHKLTQDGDIFDNTNKLLLPSNIKGMTVMIICEIDEEEAREYQNYENSTNKICIGNILMMDSQMLRVDGKIPKHNYWFFKFWDLFEECLEKVRFVELRPKGRA